MIALATCARLPGLDADDRLLLEALERRGLRARPAVWSDPHEDWAAAEAVVVRSTWDYEQQRAAFLAWAARVEGLTRLWNPAAVLGWNTHKGYLLRMAEDGLPVVPTRLVRPEDEPLLHAALDGWPDAVVKPAVGAGARGAAHVGRDGREAVRARGRALLAAGEDLLVQPYRAEVERQGELSLIWFQGAFSHAVQKRPAPGEWRIQEAWGGTRQAVEPPPGTLELATRFLTWAEGPALSDWTAQVTPGAAPLLYARVDLLPGPAGWELGELELTEPSLYLREGGPAAAERLASAIATRLRAC